MVARVRFRGITAGESLSVAGGDSVPVVTESVSFEAAISTGVLGTTNRSAWITRIRGV